VTADASIQVDSVVVEHATATGPVRALDGVSFTVDAGSSVAVTGPSGCGKSTLLGVLGGLAVPTSGAVRIGGEEISALPERRRSEFRRTHVGFVYQADNLLPFLTVVENVALQLALDAQAADPGRSLELLDRLGLAGEELPPPADRERWPELRARLEAAFRTRTRAEWVERFEGSDACVAPVVRPSEAPDHPHHRARGSFVPVGGSRQPAPAPRFSRTPPAAPLRPPAVGEHTDQVLAAGGFTRGEIADLRAVGAVA
jgi:crotonobetainyl-CoA:carnitine CoA-transferase CaiB-like acyl-CoA transferase